MGSGLAIAPGAAAADPADPADAAVGAGPTTTTTVDVAAVEPRLDRGAHFTIASRATDAAGVDAVREGRQTLIRITDPRARQGYLFDVDLPEGPRSSAPATGWSREVSRVISSPA